MFLLALLSSMFMFSSLNIHSLWCDLCSEWAFLHTQPFRGHFNLHFVALNCICSLQNYIKGKQPALCELKLFFWMCCFPCSNLVPISIFKVREGIFFPRTVWEIVVFFSLIQGLSMDLLGCKIWIPVVTTSLYLQCSWSCALNLVGLMARSLLTH